MAHPTGIGVGIPPQHIPDPWPTWDALGWPSVYDWGSRHIGQAVYTPMVWRDIKQAAEWGMNVPAQIEDNPGFPWFVANEPERSTQSDQRPEAVLSTMWALIAAGATVIGPHCYISGKDGNLWLSDFLRMGGVSLLGHEQAAAIGCHIYPNLSGRGWQWQLERFYGYLDSWGLHHSPVVISEINAGGHADKESQEIEMLHQIAARLPADDRLQAVFWFSAHYEKGCNLVENDSVTLTNVGHAFRAIVESLR